MNKRERRVMERALNALAAVLAVDARAAKNSLSRFAGVGKPLRWDADAWKQGDYAWWRRHSTAAKALDAAIDLMNEPPA